MKRKSMTMLLGAIFLIACEGNAETDANSTAVEIMNDSEMREREQLAPEAAWDLQVEEEDMAIQQSQEDWSTAYESKTYNELQLSDEREDFPIEVSGRGENYHEWVNKEI